MLLLRLCLFFYNCQRGVQEGMHRCFVSKWWLQRIRVRAAIFQTEAAADAVWVRSDVIETVFHDRCLIVLTFARRPLQ